jgi:anti-sigma B factor antagonist
VPNPWSLVRMGGSGGLTKIQAPPRVIVMPAELDAANADLFGERLGSAFVPGVTVVVADMTETIHCDSWGVRMLVLAHKRATANHAELRLAVPSAVLRHTFALAGLLLPIYPTMRAALA